MKTLALVLWILCSAVAAYAQAAPPQIQQPPTAADLEQQLEAVGCKAERQAAASTIVQLQKQNQDLQKQITAKDPPPKSGATKH